MQQGGLAGKPVPGCIPRGKTQLRTAPRGKPGGEPAKAARTGQAGGGAGSQTAAAPGHSPDGLAGPPCLAVCAACAPPWQLKTPLFPLPLCSRPQRLSKRVKLVRDIVREVAGQAPYEKRLMELLKVGKDKRALKVAKRKVSSGNSAQRVGSSEQVAGRGSSRPGVAGGLP